MIHPLYYEAQQPGLNAGLSLNSKHDRTMKEPLLIRYSRLNPVKFNPRFKDLTSKQFGQLKTVKCIGVNFDGRAIWRCLCSCGNAVDVIGKSLRNGHTKSCGCRKVDAVIKRCTTHNGTHTALYGIWAGIVQRCTNKNTMYWRLYGGRGVKLAKQWRDFETFRKYVGERPSARHSIDRWPNRDGNYEPGNVRWATMSQQSRNKRTNRIVTIRGRQMCLAEAAEVIGINYHSLHYRITHGWSFEDAIHAPFNKK